ncbi:MAG: class I SAM-dependent methyltransferase [Myxococcota bacterium]
MHESYADRPVAQTHPSVLFEVARRWGIEPGPSTRARVLEIGCAHGVNVIAMAARMPEATFVGVDVDAAAVGVGRRRIEELGLRNVQLHAVDLAAFEAEASSFDAIVAHGVFSWVDEDTRAALWRLLARALSPAGIAYLSYNVRPGDGIREVLRMAVAISDASPASALEALREAPGLQATHRGKAVLAEIDAALSYGENYVAHEYATAHHQAFSVSEVWETAEAHGLHYVDDVAPMGIQPEAFAIAAAEACARHEDRRAAEQMLDLAVVRQFRATLLSKTAPARTRLAATKEHAAKVPPMPTHPRVLPLTRLESVELGFVSTPGNNYQPLHPLHAALLEAMDGTRDREALVALVRARVDAGEVTLPTQQGTPPTTEELDAGLGDVVDAALRDCLGAGLIVAEPAARPR